MVIVITGASAGVGPAVARRYAQRGASIALIARGAVGLEAARREVHELGGRAITIEADVATIADRADNLFQPVPVDAGAHGVFDALATSRSPQLWAEKHRGVLAAAVAALVVGSLVGWSVGPLQRRASTDQRTSGRTDQR